MIAQLLAEQHFEFLSIEGGCAGSSESTLVKLSHCWKSHVLAHIYLHRLAQDSEVFMAFQYLSRDI